MKLTKEKPQKMWAKKCRHGFVNIQYSKTEANNAECMVIRCNFQPIVRVKVVENNWEKK